MSKYSRDFICKSSGVDTWSSHRVNCVASMVFRSSFFTPSMNFDAIAKFRSDFLSSRLLLRLSNSRSSKNLSMDSSMLPLNSKAETIQQEVQYLASAVSFIGLFDHYPI